jgi:hypothetical protein
VVHVGPPQAGLLPEEGVHQGLGVQAGCTCSSMAPRDHQGLIGTKRNKLGCQEPPTMLHMCTCEH